MVIGIGADHGGFKLKETVIDYLLKKKYEVRDFGTFAEESVDYPDFAEKVCKGVSDKEIDLGILICGTGIGMSIAANKIKGIRCAICNDPYSSKMAKKHNDANVIALGARVIGDGLALSTIEAFLKTHFEGGRHQSRLDLISKLENNE